MQWIFSQIVTIDTHSAAMGVPMVVGGVFVCENCDSTSVIAVLYAIWY